MRDGEQSPGASMTPEQKLEVAKVLEGLGVDVIEAGFPVASPENFRSVQQIAREIRGCSICALARCETKDIDAAWEAVKEAEKPRIHVFIATSEIHMKEKLHMTHDEVIASISKHVRLAVGKFKEAGIKPNVEFSPEDALRTEAGFLCKAVETAIEEGATTVNIPDTVGYATPDEMRDLIIYLRTKVKNIDNAVISVHCHDDLGNAVSNSMSAIKAGAGQVECTVNGLGERAGNASLEEIVMNIAVRPDQFKARTNINTRKLVPASRTVAHASGMAIQRNKAIVGKNAFAHEAGIHQHGILQNRETYEIMRPQDVGWEETDLVLGKQSGWHAVRNRFEKYGLPFRENDRQAFMNRFKITADSKAANIKYVPDEELIDLVYFPCIERIALEYEEARKKTISKWDDGGRDANGLLNATLTTSDGLVYRSTASNRDEGAIDAIVNAINLIMPGVNISNEGLVTVSIGGGSDTEAKSTVTMHNGYTVSRTVVDKNTEKSQHMALIGAFNRLVAIKTYEKICELPSD